MKKISLTPIRKKLSSLQINYRAFIFLKKKDRYTIVMTVVLSHMHEDDLDLIFGILDEDYHIRKISSSPEEYALILK